MRPTADRVRESVFASLGPLEGARVLDLFAGSGALGVEALSRGAASATFVERAAPALGALRRNLDALGLAEVSRVLRGDVRVWLGRLGRRGERFDLVLADPPYRARELPRLCAALLETGVLAPGARVVVEAARGDLPSAPPGLAVEDERRYGDTAVRRLVFTDAQREERMSSSHRPTIGLFAASFDPVTNGHLDLVERARRVFDELVLAVGRNLVKAGTFSLEERIEMLESALAGDKGIRVTSFEGLVVDYAREIGATAVVRGLRAMSDFEYEFEMALMNKHLNPELDTVFMMTAQKYFYVSSSRLKELVRFGMPVDDFVPPLVAKKLREKLGPN